MKKLVLVAIMMLVPFSAFALDSMNDDALDKLTAQEGVTITFENVVIDQTASDIAWSDADGVTDAPNAGRIYVDQSGSTVTTITGSLKIDVATVGDTALAIAAPTNGVASSIAAKTSFVKIELPNVSQGAAAKTMTIKMDNNLLTTNTAYTSQTLGTLYQDAGSSKITGAVYIYGH